MGGTYDHPSPLSVKHRMRAYLMGKDSSLMGAKYNTLGEIKENCFTLSSCSTSTNEQSAEIALNSELCLSAMSFIASASDDREEITDNMGEEEVDLGRSLENATHAQGMAYFGGYIVRKFPHHNLGSKFLKSEKSSWIDAIGRQSEKLMKPNDEFLRKLQIMGQLFNCYHGETTLKPGKAVMTKLAKEMQQHVDLPEEVLKFYVRCRTFFRMRILNGKIRRQGMERKLEKKMKKVTS